MNEPRYSVKELQHLLTERRPVFAEAVVSKLTYGEVFDAAAFQLRDSIGPDGRIALDDPALRALIGAWIGAAVTETVNIIIDDIEAP